MPRKNAMGKPPREGLSTPEARVLWHLTGLDHATLESYRDTGRYPAVQMFTLHYGPPEARRSLVMEEGVLATLVERRLLEPYDTDWVAMTWKLRITEEGRRVLATHQATSQAGKPRDLAH